MQEQAREGAATHVRGGDGAARIRVAVGIVLTAVRSSVALGLAALGAAFLTGISAASSAPYLRSAAANRGHVVAVFTFGVADTDMTPGHIAVASKPAIQADGSFVS